MGHIGKRHAALIHQHPEAELAAVCDILPEDRLAIEPAEVPFFRSIDALLEADLPLDVICICTPNGLHAEQAQQALLAGKHVLIEKPMALSKAECEAVVHTSLQAGKHAFCVMQNRYSPPAIWLKQVIDEQQLGEIQMVQINCYWNRDARYYQPGGWRGTADLDGGTLFTQFSHFVDMMYWLFGDIADIEARFADFRHQEMTDFEDSGIVHFRFVKGGMGSINYSTAIWDKNMESSLTVVGSKGSLKIGGQYMNEVEYCHIEGMSPPQLPPANPPYDYGPYKGSAANHVYVIQNVIDVLNGRQPIATNVMEGMKVVEIIERIYARK